MPAVIGVREGGEVTICRKFIISVIDFMQKLPERASLDWVKLTAEKDAVDFSKSNYVLFENPCITSINQIPDF